MANTTNKITNSKALAFVLDSYELPSDVREKIENIKASIDKKATNKSSKPTAKQLENAKLTDVIYNALQGCEPMTVTDIIKTVPELAGLSTQRVRPMLVADKFANETVKGKSLYRVK